MVNHAFYSFGEDGLYICVCVTMGIVAGRFRLVDLKFFSYKKRRKKKCEHT